MSKPGAGRYTAYVPPEADGSNKRYAARYAVFNALSTVKGGDFILTTNDNAKAAGEIVALASANVDKGKGGGLLPSNGKQFGDSSMFPTGIDLVYANHPNVPDTSDPKAINPATIYGNMLPMAVDLPWTNYVPNISSPGAVDGQVNLSSADKPPSSAAASQTLIKEFKSNSGGDTLAVASPKTESSKTTFTLGDFLKLGSK